MPGLSPASQGVDTARARSISRDRVPRPPVPTVGVRPGYLPFCQGDLSHQGRRSYVRGQRCFEHKVRPLHNLGQCVSHGLSRLLLWLARFTLEKAVAMSAMSFSSASRM